MVYRTLPLGFKSSAYIYHNLGMVATGYCRQLGVPISQYIDDRLISELETSYYDRNQGSRKTELALYIVCQVFTRLGYTFGLKKCVFQPVQCLKHLGFMVDSIKQAFILPKDKIKRFLELREYLLSCSELEVRSLQRFAGKCISFSLAIPAAKLYTIEVNRSISWCLRNSKTVIMDDFLWCELEHWRFIDSWKGFVSWREEKHLQSPLFTDSSKFKWGAMVMLQGKEVEMSDFWSVDDSRPIHLKEASALYCALMAVQDTLKNHRVDAYVDNTALVKVWENHGRKAISLNRIVKDLYQVTYINNIDLILHYIPSKCNPADAPSRKLTFLDCMLTKKAWDMIQ